VLFVPESQARNAWQTIRPGKTIDPTGKICQGQNATLAQVSSPQTFAGKNIYAVLDHEDVSPFEGKNTTCDINSPCTEVASLNTGTDYGYFACKNRYGVLEHKIHKESNSSVGGKPSKVSKCGG
jgi:hypothetical protein